MKQCTRCQAENFDDQKFCTLCGKELTQRVVVDLHAGRPPVPREAPVREDTRPEEQAYKHFLKAKEHIAHRDLDGAIAEFKAALALCPRDPMIERLLIKTKEAKASTKGRPGAQRPVPARPATGPQRAQTVSLPEAVSHLTSSPPARAHAPTGTDITWPDLSSPLGAGVRRAAAELPGHEPTHEPKTARPKAKGEGAHAAHGPARHKVTDLIAHRMESAHAQGGKPSAHTGRFLEVYTKTPALSPALVLDAHGEDGFKEIVVTVLMLGAFLAFGFLLLL